MSKDILRLRDRSSTPLEPRLAMTGSAWALRGIILEDEERLPLLARLMADEYEDTRYGPQEIAALQAEIDTLAGLFRRFAPGSRLETEVGLAVPVEDVLSFLNALSGIAARAQDGGNWLVARSD